MEAIAKSIDLIQSNNYKLIENNSEEMTYYRFPTREDVKEFRKLGKSLVKILTFDIEDGFIY